MYNKNSYACEWKIGDVFAYKIECEEAKELNMHGRYFLFRKVDETIWYPNIIIPIVYVKVTENEHLPTTIDEYDRLRYIQIFTTKYEDRFFPIDGRRPLEDIAEKSKITYQTDEYGYLPQFRLKLITKSKLMIPKKLIYIGNFQNVELPLAEFIPHSKVNIRAENWKSYNKLIDSRLLDFYKLYNLRESPIYRINE